MTVSHSALLRGRRWLPRLFVTCYAFFAWHAGNAEAQPQMLRFQHLRSEDGLSQRSGFAVLQDSRGFVWIGTQDGLNRYDGYSITVFSHTPRQDGTLSNSFVRALAEDSNGSLWVGTLGGLNRFDSVTGQFERFLSVPDDPSTLSGEDVRALHVDPNGLLWVATRDGGLDRVDPISGRVTHFALPIETPELSGASALTGDSQGRLWIGLRDGLASLPPGAELAVRFRPDVLTGEVQALYQSPSGPLWAGTESGLWRLDPTSGEVKSFVPDPADPRSLSDPVVRAILGTGDGKLWIGTDGGLNLLDPSTGHFAVYKNEEGDLWSLSYDGVISLAQDRSGLLWVGTLLGGVDRVQPDPLFSAFGRQAGVPNALGSAQVVAFGEEPSGDVLIGTFGGGLFEWQRDRERFVAAGADAQPPLEDARTMAVVVDKQGDWWVGTVRAGLAHRAHEGGGFTHFRHDPNDPDSISSDGVPSLLEDSAGRLWVGTFRGGLDYFDRQHQVFRHYRQDLDDPNTLGGSIVQVLEEGSDGRLWIGLFDGGLDRLDPATGHFDHFRPRTDDITSLPSDSVISLHLDAENRLWVGTFGSGLARLDDSAKGGRFRTWSDADGLPNNAINGIESDSRGRIFISTHSGLALLDPDLDEIRVFTVRHGLPSDDFFASAHLATRDGTLLFGNAEGMVAFDPDRITDSPKIPPPLALTALSIGNRPAVLDRPLNDLESLRLDDRDRSVTFEFSALDFSAPEETKYRYRLDGFDDQWVEMVRRQPTTYTNLDAGDYVFRVSACTADGACNEDGIAVALHVEPAPWQTWWAYVSYLLLSLGLIYGAIRWRLEGLRRRSLELAALVERRTGELSSTVEQLRRSEGEATEAQRRALKSLEEALEERRRAQEANRAKSTFLSHMSHELRTPLNAILGFAQLMERDPDLTSGHREGLSAILRSGEHLLGLINDVLSLAKIEAGKLSLANETFDSRRMLTGVEEMVRGRAEAKGLELSFTGLDSVPQAVRGDSGRLIQVLANLLSNAVKFTDHGRVDLRVSWHDDQARFEVEDTGPGIGTADLERLFEPFVQSADGSPKEGTGLGLAISRRLVEIMGGTLEVWSEVGKGSTFAFEIPLAEASSSRLERRRRRVAGLALDQEPPRILVVDDAEENRRLLRRFLGSVGIIVRDAADGAEAVELWASWRPQLIWMDMRMPRVDGYEATRRIRKAEAQMASNRTIIIALTATAFEHDRRRILAAGCDDVVTKPFQEAVLFDKLAEHLDVRFVFGSDAGPASTPSPDPSDPPGSQPTEGDATSRQSGFEKPQAPSWRILVAEDNSANQLVARRMLERLGLGVEVVSNGRAAVDAFHQQDFDLVLMDIRMPEMSGLQATRRLRRRLARERQPVIVALTGLASEEERRQCLDAGMDAVLAKPFRLDDLESVVEKWLPPPTSERPQPKGDGEESSTGTVKPGDVEAVRRSAEMAYGTLDYIKLEALRQLDQGTGVPLATQVIDLFLDTVPTQVDDLRRAVADGDRHRWRRLAHSLKNSSDTLGADDLAAACRQLEDLGRRPTTNDLSQKAAAMLDRVVAAATEALAALESERDSN